MCRRRRLADKRPRNRYQSEKKKKSLPVHVHCRRAF